MSKRYTESGFWDPNKKVDAAFPSPSEDGSVLALCERYGFGAVMGSASRQWRARDPKGALSVGDCFGNMAKRAGDWMAGPIGLPMRKLYDLANGVEELEAIYNALYDALSKEPFSLSEGESDGKL